MCLSPTYLYILHAPPVMMKARLLTPELEITSEDKVYSTNALALPHTHMLIKLAAYFIKHVFLCNRV